ncbi:AAA family ATPase [Methylovirgula sp. HY1]|uniref:AAA family ATPase n=1 Tax=Methylovirgula sp. HY1 TaxID=2822761 RepID=UPI001C5B7E53|nr:AAA family ATPase [Methylovirgula sp. HY1]
MTQKLIAFTGLSGAGKTTFLARLKTPTMQILQAEEIIKSARQTFGQAVSAVDDLRSADLGVNQDLLVGEFVRLKDRSAEIVVLDCHVVIEAESGLSRVEAAIFESIGITGMIFLRGSPEEIVRRREVDRSRRRAAGVASDLEEIQEIAHAHAQTICDLLRVPLTTVFLGDDNAATERELRSLLSPVDQ